jgi:uncharacterized protein
MSKGLNTLYLTITLVVLTIDLFSQRINHINQNGPEYTREQIEYFINKPLCSDDNKFVQNTDFAFTNEKITVNSDGKYITGVLYLPNGKGKHPIVILTNTGGLDSTFSETFPNNMLLDLLKCKIACLIYDQRGIGESEGSLRTTTYNNYATDVGNFASFLANHPKIDSTCIGVIGYSEGGRIAVLSANRVPIIKYVVSVASSVVSSVDDRIYAQKGWLESLNLPDSVFYELFELHKKTILAWKDNNKQSRNKIDEEITIIRKKYNSGFSPFTFYEFNNNPQLERALPTWNSIQFDYLSELEFFNKKWLAIFGNEDIITPTKQSIENIKHFMSVSGNSDYFIANIPECGHNFINNNTGKKIHIEYLIINWIAENILNK